MYIDTIATNIDHFGHMLLLILIGVTWSMSVCELIHMMCVYVVWHYFLHKTGSSGVLVRSSPMRALHAPSSTLRPVDASVSSIPIDSGSNIAVEVSSAIVRRILARRRYPCALKNFTLRTFRWLLAFSSSIQNETAIYSSILVTLTNSQVSQFCNPYYNFMNIMNI